MGSKCVVVELQNISHCCQQYKVTQVTMQIVQHFCQTITKSETSQQIFIECSIKYLTNIRQLGAAMIRAARRADGGTDTTELIGAFRERLERA
jgi:hypothetical protein